jgi:hypothetical protein
MHGSYGARLHRPPRPPTCRAEPLDANDVIEHGKQMAKAHCAVQCYRYLTSLGIR